MQNKIFELKCTLNFKLIIITTIYNNDAANFKVVTNVVILLTLKMYVEKINLSEGVIM